MGDEKQIISDILCGDTNQYKILVEKYQNPVFRVINQIVNNMEDAKELTQDVFVKAYVNLCQYNMDFKFFSWIYRIAINTALLSVKRKKQYVDINNMTEVLFHTPDELGEDDNELIVKMTIKELSKSYRSVLLLKYYADLSYSDIAETLNIPEKTVKSRLFDARKSLRDKLLKKPFFTLT